MLHEHCLGQGPGITLLHGWGLHSGIWAPLLPELHRGCRLCLLDLPGHGHSPAPPPAATPLAAWSTALAPGLRPDEVWLGWSLGGTLALQVARHGPRRPRALVLLAASPCFIQRRGWQAGIAPGVLADFAGALEADRAALMGRFLALQVRGSAQAPATLRQLRALLAAAPPPQAAALAAGLQILRETDLRGALAALDVPMLWLLGERDTLVPAALAAELTMLAPRSEVQVVRGAGHAPFISHPAEVAGHVLGFLARQGITAPSGARA